MWPQVGSKVAADHQRWPVGEAPHEFQTRACPLLLVHVEVAGVAGSASWIGWCIRSPVITASSPRERINTLTCGVWPGVGINDTSSVIWKSGSMNSTGRPAPPDRQIGEVFHVVIAARGLEVLPVLVFAAARQVARLREGRYPLLPHAHGVPADVIEKCRCVHSTACICSRGKPAMRRSSRNVVCMPVNTSNSRR
jgi:hypothetical protein